MDHGNDNAGASSDSHTLGSGADFTPLPPGTLLTERYRILCFLGRGGFAAVYAARDELLDETVALKIFFRGFSMERSWMLRIRREISLSRRITDSRVLRVYSLELWGDHWFLVMELVEGETLRDCLRRRGAISWQEFKTVFLEILAGVSALHALNIIHRDIKPSNIMLTGNGGVKILDFGLAKELGDPERSISVDEVVGTPRYLSPEQLRGEEADVRSDVFQLGLLLQTVLKGTPPLEGLGTLSILARRMGKMPVSLDLGGLELPAWVRIGLERALRKRPASRFGDATAMLKYFSNEKQRLHVILARTGKLLPWGGLLAVVAIGIALWVMMSPKPEHPQEVKVEDSILSLVDRRGQVLWKKDFSPRVVYRAELQHCVPPLQMYRSNLKTRHLVYAFLSSVPGLNQDNQPSLGDTRGDGRMLQIMPDGEVLVDKSMSSIVRAGDYGFVSRAYVTKYEKRDLNGDGAPEIIANLVHSRGMFPNALLLISRGHLLQVVSPGAFDQWAVTPGGDGGWRFTLRGVGNRMGHLSFLARLEISTRATPGGIIKLIPHLEDNRRGFGNEPSLLIYFPRRFSVSGEAPLPTQGPVALINPKGDRLHIREDGTMKLVSDGTERVFHDPPDRMKAVYRDIHFALQARDLRYDLGEAARKLESAAAGGVENPWLRAVIEYFRGDIEVSRGHYKEGRRRLRFALEGYPGLTDAAHRLLEAVLLHEGPREALRMMDRGEFADYKGFWGLAGGRDFFKNLCMLMVGDFEGAGLFSLRLEQEASQNAALLQALISFMRGENMAADIPRDNTEMSLLYTWEEYRLLEGRAHLAAGAEPERGVFCFRDVDTYSRLRRHLAAMSLAWYALRDGHGRDAERMARAAFRDLEVRALGNLETRFWWFYDSWVYGRIMEELGHAAEARRGYAACIAANPHTFLAARSRRRLAGL